MRGEDLFLPSGNEEGFRNTSTCVEKTKLSAEPISPTRKHLHVRGEDPKNNIKINIVNKF